MNSRSWSSAVVVVALVVAAAACSDDGDVDEPPFRIDGPAEVDPDFDPFATVATPPPVDPSDDPPADPPGDEDG